MKVVFTVKEVASFNELLSTVGAIINNLHVSAGLPDVSQQDIQTLRKKIPDYIASTEDRGEDGFVVQIHESLILAGTKTSISFYNTYNKTLLLLLPALTAFVGQLFASYSSLQASLDIAKPAIKAFASELKRSIKDHTQQYEADMADKGITTPTMQRKIDADLQKAATDRYSASADYEADGGYVRDVFEDTFGDLK